MNAQKIVLMNNLPRKAVVLTVLMVVVLGLLGGLVQAQTSNPAGGFTFDNIIVPPVDSNVKPCGQNFINQPYHYDANVYNRTGQTVYVVLNQAHQDKAGCAPAGIKGGQQGNIATLTGTTVYQIGKKGSFTYNIDKLNNWNCGRLGRYLGHLVFDAKRNLRGQPDY